MNETLELLDMWHAGFIKRCNRLKLEEEQDMVILLLDNADDVAGHYHCKDVAHIDQLMLMAKKENTAAICVARNVISPNEMTFNDEIENMIALFKESSEKVEIPFRDFLLVTRYDSVSAAASGLM